MRRVLAALLTLGVAAGFVRAATAAPPADGSGVELRVLRSDASVLEIEWTSTEPALREVATKEGTAHVPVLRGGVHLAEAGAPDVMSIVRLIAVPADGPLPRVSVSSDGIAIEGTQITVRGDDIGVDSPALG